MNLLLRSLIVFCFCINLAYSAPTEKREWNTSSGHTTVASALKIEYGKVHFRLANGKVVKVKMRLLVDEDQKFLKKHFNIDGAADDVDEDDGADEAEDKKAGPAPSGSGKAEAKGLAHTPGELSGPITHEGSSYYVYVPKTLKEGRKASLLFYTHSGGGGTGGQIKKLAEAAETLGWIMAISVECKNGNAQNIQHVTNCLNHLLQTLPIDEDRIHYSGNSGGAALAFVNTTVKKAFGVMPNIGYIPQTVDVKAKVVYGMGGGNDYNKYLTAYAADKFRKNGFHRMNTGGHGGGPDDHYMDGMIWMHCKYMEMGKPSSDEKKDFEASIINWMNEIKTTNPKRAYSTACIVRDVYEISGDNGKVNDALIKELAKDNTNVLYHEGLLAIDELSGKRLADLGESGGSKMKHFSKEAARAAEKLKEKYAPVKEIIDVLDAIIKKTV